MAGFPLKEPPVWMSSTESITSATSRMRTTPCPDAAPDVDEGVVAAVTPLCGLALAVAPPGPLADVVLPPAPFETALASDAGRPVLAAAELTGPRSVATIKG